MFKRKNIGMYLDSLEPAIGKDKDGEQTLETVLGFRIHPFAPESSAYATLRILVSTEAFGRAAGPVP